MHQEEQFVGAIFSSNKEVTVFQFFSRSVITYLSQTLARSFSVSLILLYFLFNSQSYSEIIKENFSLIAANFLMTEGRNKSSFNFELFVC